MTTDKYIEEFRRKYVRGVPAKSLPNGEWQEPEAWIEAEPYEVEEFIKEAITKTREETIKEILDVFNSAIDMNVSGWVQVDKQAVKEFRSLYLSQKENKE